MLTVASPAATGAASGPTLKGPILSAAETPSISWARDGGFSVPLPTGVDFWVFGDTPRFQWQGDHWVMNAFIYGSTAAQRKFTPGKPLDGPLNEIWLGHPTRSTNSPRQFLPLPNLYMPDGSGKVCNKKNGGSKAESVRWVTGAALMPDRTNVLLPYLEVCVLGENGYTSEGWGFTLYNYKTNTFSMKPFAVFKPHPSGAEIPAVQGFGSPIINNGKITFYSWSWGGSDGGIYRTTMNATLSALKNPASYQPELIPELPMSYNISVHRPSKTHAKNTMYMLRGSEGEYDIWASASPTGTWSKVGEGQLPGCESAPLSCRSFALHPELSPAKRLMVSYYLHGFGPGIATKHPAPNQPHAVMASIPCDC